MSRTFLRFTIPLFTLVLLGQGCLGSKTTNTGPDGGVWKTTDRGQAWANKRALIQGSKLTTAASGLAIVSMAFDPQDNKAVYLGTAVNGLVYSWDAGESWQIANGLSTGKVNAVAVDSKDKCVIYAARANEIYKTDNCGRDWNKIFFDPRTDKAFTQIIADWYNPTILYAGTSDGDVYKSVDAGLSWQTSKRIAGSRINHMIMDPRDSRLVYVGTAGDGIWKTLDGGNTWLQIKKQFGEEFREARRVTQVVLDPKVPNRLYVVSKYGIIRSEDQGETWKAVNLTSPPGTIVISSLAIDPTDNNKMVYTGPKALTFTSDGGVTWTPKKLPTTRAGSALLIDPKNGSTIYLGTLPIETK